MYEGIWGDSIANLDVKCSDVFCIKWANVFLSPIFVKSYDDKNQK